MPFFVPRKNMAPQKEETKNHIDKVLCTELSRIGRDPLQILQSLEILNQNKISLYIQNFNIETLNDDKQINPMSQFLRLNFIYILVNYIMKHIKNLILN